LIKKFENCELKFSYYIFSQIKLSKKLNFSNYVCIVFCLPIFVMVPGITVDIPGSILATPLVGSKLLDIPPPPLILELE